MLHNYNYTLTYKAPKLYYILIRYLIWTGNLPRGEILSTTIDFSLSLSLNKIYRDFLFIFMSSNTSVHSLATLTPEDYKKKFRSQL